MIGLRQLIAPGIVLITAMGLFGGGYYVGSELSEKARLDRESATQEALRIATERTVQAIEQIKVENRTVVKNFRTIEQRDVVYRECKHPDDALRVLNNALQGNTTATVPGEMSE